MSSRRRNLASFCLPVCLALAAGACGADSSESPPEVGEPAPVVVPSEVVDLDVEESPAPVAGDIGAARVGDLLVWTDGENDRETFVVDAITGAVRARVKGLYVHAGGALWRATSDTRIDPLPGCSDLAGDVDENGDIIDEIHERPDAADQQSLSFEHVHGDPDDVQSLVPFVDVSPSDELRELRTSFEITGSLGPYVFVKSSRYSDACGVHGATTLESMVWDLEKGTFVDFARALPDDPSLVDDAHRLLLADGEIVFDDEPPALTELVPRFYRTTGFKLERQLTMASCFACSDRRWSDYTRSVRIERDTLPRALETHARLPPGFDRFLSADPGFNAYGVSVVR